eukprot:11090623-Alexandrium_andersonii.AAC.1
MLHGAPGALWFRRAPSSPASCATPVPKLSAPWAPPPPSCRSIPRVVLRPMPSAASAEHSAAPRRRPSWCARAGSSPAPSQRPSPRTPPLL